MTVELFEMLLSRLNNRVSGDQLLADIANQVRLANVSRAPGDPLVTPYDVFRSYRDQNERVSAKAVEIPVEKFLAQGPRADRRRAQGRITTSTRTSCPTRPVRHLVSRYLARSRSRSFRSTATRLRVESWTSSPRPSCAPRTRTARRNFRNDPSYPTTSSPASPS